MTVSPKLNLSPQRYRMSVGYNPFYTFPWYFYFFKLMQLLTVRYCNTKKKKRGKPDRKPYPLPHGLRNPYRNLKYENSQDYAQKLSKLYVHELSLKVPSGQIGSA